MKLQKTKKGFTLIELLVVITIIGILAVGGVQVFTTQLQGARDSSRISDIKLMEGAVHQYYADESAYPSATGFTGTISDFVSKDLVDPKKDIPVCRNDTLSNVECKGYYAVDDDTYNLPDGRFKLGILFEKKTNLDKKAVNSDDGGNVNFLYEVYGGAGGSGTTILSNPGTTATDYSASSDGEVVY